MSTAEDLTWDEFLALPYETRNAALINGKVVVNSPNAQHELVVRNLSYVFTNWIRHEGGPGEVSTQQPIKITDRRGYQPDFAWYPPEHCAPPGEPASFSGLPQLVVEEGQRPVRALTSAPDRSRGPIRLRPTGSPRRRRWA